jgi:uridine phosphorylase
MVRFGKNRPLILFLVAFATASVSAASMAIAASVGFYASTFDPPTRSQIRMIHCALGDDPLHKECGEIGKSISRLVVLVIEDSEKDSFASARERILMLKTALKKHGDRAEIVAATTAQAEQRIRALLQDKNFERLFQLVSADAYKDLKLSPGGQDPKLAWLVFPLEAESSSSKASAEGDQLDFNEVIEKLGLYRDVSPDLAALQRSLFEEGWTDFLEDLKSACPINVNEKTCAELAPRWDAISIVAADDSKNGPVRKEAATRIQLVYKRSQSEDRWAEKFVKTALEFVRGSETYDKLKPIADDIAARVIQGYPYGKLPHLRRVSIKKNSGSIGPFKVSQKPVACSTPQGSYGADMDQYLADRFPRAFTAFLKEKARQRSTLPIELYVHNHPFAEAYQSHQRDGYDTFYFLQTRRGQFHRDIYLAVKSYPETYRVVVTSVRGNDRQANVLCQIQRTRVFSNYHSVESRQPHPLFVFNSQGHALRLDPNDVLLFGFKGNWARMLTAKNWHQRPLVKEGLDIDLFTHPTTNQKIVVARNVYGDDTDIILDVFYKKGIRQIVYLGLAGAVADYRIGDVVIPKRFTDRHYNTVLFDQNFAGAYQSELAQLVNVRSGKTQGWVQSLFDETKELLLDWRENSVVSVDVEGLYLAKFARAHSDLRIAALFVMSDETLGDITIEETNAFRGVIDESVGKLMSVLFSKVVSQTNP